MTAPRAFHLPGLDAERLPLRPLAQTGLEVPDLDPDAVARVWRALDAGAERWRQRPAADRAGTLARLAATLRRRGPGEWENSLARSTGLSPAGLSAAWDATFAPHDAAALHAAQRDGAHLGAGARPGGRPPRVVHVLAGNVLSPTFTMLVRGWLVGVAQWLRPSAREPLFAACVAAAIREQAPELADACAVLWWPHSSPTEAAVLAEASVVTAQGDDDTVLLLRDRVARQAPHARFVGYGTRWSLALLSRAAQTDANALRLAWDVALFDQQGCLSPSLVLAEDGAGLAGWCARFGRALADLERRMPRGPVAETAAASLRLWRESMRLGVALGEIRELWESAGTSAWAVALLDHCSGADSPLERHVPVVPFGSEAEILPALGTRTERLQGVAVDLAGWDPARRAALLARLQPTRIAPPGELQFAPAGWPQDHHPPLACLS